jgi:hypothetical protein
MLKPFEVEVSSKYGAPMGRPSTPVTGKVHLQRVRLVAGDYDKGGAYWGGPADLWCAWSDEGAFYFRVSAPHGSYFRPDRQAAKKKLPNCTFYR